LAVLSSKIDTRATPSSHERKTEAFTRSRHQGASVSSALMPLSPGNKKQMNRSPILPIMILVLLLVLIRFLSG